MNVTIVVEKQVAAMIRDNCQLCLKILRERFGIRSLSPPQAFSPRRCLTDIADILMLLNHCFTAFFFVRSSQVLKFRFSLTGERSK